MLNQVGESRILAAAAGPCPWKKEPSLTTVLTSTLMVSRSLVWLRPAGQWVCLPQAPLLPSGQALPPPYRVIVSHSKGPSRVHA